MRSHVCSALAGVGLVASSLTSGFAQEKKLSFPTNEQLRHFGAIGNPRLSPDSKHVLLQVTDTTADGAKTHLWLIDVDGGGKRQLTFSPEGDRAGERSGEWMPDGQSILFVAHRGEKTSLYQLPMNGGEARRFDLQVTPLIDTSKAPDAVPPVKADAKKDEKAEPLAIDVGGYRIAPDGKSIALLVSDPETPGEKKQKDAKADAEWVDHNPHGTRLYLMDVASSKLTLAAVPTDVRGATWSPDSKQLVALANAPNGAGDLAPDASAWMVQADDLDHPVKIAAMPPTVGSITWSRDASLLIFGAQARADAPPGVGDDYEYTIATKTVRNLSDGFMGSVGRGEAIALKGGGFLEIVDRGFDVAPAKFMPGVAAPQPLKMPVAAVGTVVTNEAQNGWLFLGSDGAHPAALYYATDLASAPRVLPTPAVMPEGLATIAAKRIEWKSDAYTIQGTLYLPPEAAAGKVPLIVQVHGGPTGNYSDNYSAFRLFLLGHGWAVLETNPRGSTGRGAAFAAANKNDLGGGDYRDIMAGVDYVIKSEQIDAARMALIGYSYGGEMAAFVEGKTDRFKAIVSAAPVIDQMSEYGTERGSYYDRWFYGKPWEHQADAWRQSPLSFVAKAKTPFMLLQGEADSTDPLGQSLEMYRALRQMGVPVELVQYPRDDHGPLSGAIYGGPVREPWHGFDARQRVVAFFEKAFGTAK